MQQMSAARAVVPKVHKSAVCIIPSYHIISPIQRIRCFQDKSFVRWPPHINLLYPFWEDAGSNFAAAADRIANAVVNTPPFKLVLSQLQHFDHGGSCTAWLDATHSSELLSLQAALMAAFPECTDLAADPGRGITSFVPHLSIGQWRDKAALKQQLKEVSSSWQPLEWGVWEVALISRQGYNDPFTVRYTVPLGPGAAPTQVDVPYVATTAADNPWRAASAADPQHRCRFGLGGAPSGVWNFAYGANMSPTKLVGSRGLHPAASLPGVLHGYCLAFNHRGGFGNLMPAASAGDGGGAAAVGNGGGAAAAAASGSGAGAVADGVGASGVGAVVGSGGAGTAAAGVGAAGGDTSTAAADGGRASSSSSSSSSNSSCNRADGSGSGGSSSGGPLPLEQLGQVHGVLHQLTAAQLAALSNHEHEYWPMEVQVQPYQPPTSAGSTPAGSTLPGSTQQYSPAPPSGGPGGVLTAVAYISPPERCTRLGLPPTCRYLTLLRQGAAQWQLSPSYTALLDTHPCLPEGAPRGEEYYSSPQGRHLAPWPKIRTGGESGAGRGRGRGRGKGRGRGNPAAGAGEQEAKGGGGAKRKEMLPAAQQ